MFAWLPQGDRLAALSVLEERAARLAPEFLPVLRAARATSHQAGVAAAESLPLTPLL
ncbi:hypothetical protein [Deinococcus aluminii]|uniref:hypothetical protein n=1 Tax=Deinococcus aluminii TaxID=1656885 RepID=UPI0031E76DCD